MWKDFYNFSSKDSTSLKNSTTIPFNLWQQVTDLLLNNDESDICSLRRNESCLKICYVFQNSINNTTNIYNISKYTLQKILKL